MTTQDTVLTDERPAGSDTSEKRRRRQTILGRVLTRKPRKRSRIAVILAASWVGLVVLTALTVQWLPLADVGVTVGPPNQGLNWSWEFLGTDGIGRSELSRLAHGARASLLISVVACAMSLAVGATLGMLSAYFGSWLTAIADVIANAILAVPGLLLLLAIVLALQPSMTTLMLALSVIFVPEFMRMSRAHAKTELARDYVLSARFLGASKARLMFREVMPNSITPIISYAALVVPSLMMTEGSLSFLGHGIPAPTPSWGGMVAQGQPFLAQYPMTVLLPCFALFFTVFALNVLGDALRVKLDVREAQL